MHNKKLAVILFTITIIGIDALVPGCTSPGPAASPVAGSVAPAALSGSIDVIGSTSVGPYAAELAAAFDAKNNNRTSVDVLEVGSTAGINAVVDGTADIGMSSRNLTRAEADKGLKTYKIADDGIAIIVNERNGINGLTTEQIRGIFSGNMTNWKQVGGADADIVVVTREAGSGTRDGFESLVMQKKANITRYAIQQGTTGAVKTYVQGNKNAISYISFSSLTPDVKALQVDGITPSMAAIKDKSYKVQRPFLFVTGGEPTKPVAKAFIEYTLSPEGQAILARYNLVTVS